MWTWGSKVPRVSGRASAARPAWSGNVVVIEHNTDMILAADHVLDMGPGGGENGGLVVSQGTPEAIVADPDSVTGRFLMQERRDRLKRRG